MQVAYQTYTTLKGTFLYGVCGHVSVPGSVRVLRVAVQMDPRHCHHGDRGMVLLRIRGQTLYPHHRVRHRESGFISPLPYFHHILFGE